MFGFHTSGPDPTDDLKPYKFVNPLRDLFEDIAPPYEPQPKGQIYPPAPGPLRNWYPGMGFRGIKEETFIPKPFPGEPQQETQTIIPRGTDGMNSFINIIVDVSTSMRKKACTYKGEKMTRCDIARYVAALLVRMAQITDSHFGIYGFGKGGYVEWKGSPSRDYDGAIDWLTTWTDPYPDPLAARYNMPSITPLAPRDNATNLDQGLRVCIDTLKGIKVDQCVTLMVTDVGADTGSLLLKRDCLGVNYEETGKSLDLVLRSAGPLFYCFVESAEKIATLRGACDRSNDLIDQTYGRKIEYDGKRPVFYVALDVNDATDTMTLGSEVLSIGKMSK